MTADLLRRLQPGGAFGIYQVRSDSPDTLLPVLVDSGGNVQARALARPDPDRVQLEPRRQLRPLRHGRRRAERRAGSPPIPGSEGEPVWTPDGARLVYTATPRGGAPQLVSMPADGGDARPLTASTGGNRSPDVSPDGRRVAFVSTRDGNPEIYETDIDGGEARRLTKTSATRNRARATCPTAT